MCAAGGAADAGSCCACSGLLLPGGAACRLTAAGPAGRGAQRQPTPRRGLRPHGPLPTERAAAASRRRGCRAGRRCASVGGTRHGTRRSPAAGRVDGDLTAHQICRHPGDRSGDLSVRRVADLAAAVRGVEPVQQDGQRLLSGVEVPRGAAARDGQHLRRQRRGRLRFEGTQIRPQPARAPADSALSSPPPRPDPSRHRCSAPARPCDATIAGDTGHGQPDPIAAARPAERGTTAPRRRLLGCAVAGADQAREPPRRRR